MRKVDFARRFERELKQLEKKYGDAAFQIEDVLTLLESGALPGIPVPKVGYEVYKMRLGSDTLGRGKRGAYRVVYYLRTPQLTVLLSIYAKTEREDISVAEIRRIIKDHERENPL